jgi:hypothetical protein
MARSCAGSVRRASSPHLALRRRADRAARRIRHPTRAHRLQCLLVGARGLRLPQLPGNQRIPPLFYSVLYIYHPIALVMMVS